MIKKAPAATSTKESSLRARAESFASKSPAALRDVPSEDIRKIIHELQVYQIELEMQNDELRKAQIEIEQSRSRYVDLYDFSPVGYITLSKTSRVLEANLAAAGLLGVPRRSLIGAIFTQFLPAGKRDLFLNYKSEVLESADKLAHELELIRADRTPFWASFHCLTVQDPEGGPPKIQCAVSDITERKAQEEKIRWDYAYRQAVDNSILIGVAAWDPDGRQSYVNRAFCRMFGWAREKLVGARPPFVYWPAEESSALFRLFSEVSLRKPTGTHEFSLRRKSGERFDALVYLSPLIDPAGKMTGWVGSFGDITERKVAEAEIRRLNEDLEARVRKRTAELEKANRTLRDEDRKVRRTHAKLEDKTRELRQLMDTLEERVQERTAKLAEVNTSLRAEIAQRERTERERLRLEAAADQATEGMVITDAEGRIQYANAAFERQAALSKGRLLDKSYYDFVGEAGGGDESTRQKMRDIVRLGLSWSFHLSRKSPGGEPREFDIIFSPIKDKAGALINYLAVERDVTEQYQLNQYVLRSQKLEALGTLAGGIAHDFNNLLTPIILNMELGLLELPEDSSLRPHLEAPLAAARRGRELISQIITFSRQKELRKERLGLAPLVKETLSFLRPSLPANVTVRQHFSAAQAAVLADPGQIQQLVMNLHSNAIYAMKESGGALDVTLVPVEVDRRGALDTPDLRPGPYLKLTFKDTGVGMTPEVAGKVFDPFFTTKKSGEGSGMGLAVVSSIVRSLNGTVSVESQAGAGSTFTVCIPRIEGGLARKEREPRALPQGRESVLLVEDERIQVETLEKALGKLGYAVRGVDGSLEALDLFRRDPSAFDIVVTDQSMPEMTGIELAREILALRPGLPVILCTGFSETVDAELAAAAGVRRFMLKPFTLKEIAGAVRRALDERR